MKKAVAPGIYFNEATGAYTYRPFINKRRTERTLDAKTLREAMREYARVVDNVDERCKVSELAELYISGGAPSKAGAERDAGFVKSEQDRLVMVVKFFGNFYADEISVKHCLDYKTWRVRQIKRGTPGLRTVDMDLTTLSNVLHYAALKGEITANPLAARPRFRASSAVEHCREHCARSGDELHIIASRLLNAKRTVRHVLGWQILFEATSGCRTGEALPLRWDAGPGEPGHIREGKYLCIERLKQGDDDSRDYIRINPALKIVLKAMKNWRDKMHTKSPWFFPSSYNLKKPVGPSSLSHALCSILPKLLPGRRITSHGQRAFYVTWRRIQKTPLHTIAEEVGHNSGVLLLQTTYGKRIPAWAEKDFSPFPRTETAAWESWLKKPENILSMASA